MEHHSMSDEDFHTRYGVTPREVEDALTRTVDVSPADSPNGDTRGPLTRLCATWPWNCSREACAGGLL